MNTNTEYQSLAERARALAAREELRTVFTVALEDQAEANETVQTALAVEHGLSLTLVATAAWFALALHTNRSDSRFFPPDWLEPTRSGNPDVVMACVLCQLANYGYAVVDLVTMGLDTPARALLRSTADLCYMLTALSADRDTFQTFVLDDTSSPKEHWYKLFSNRKLASRIATVDQAMGFPKDWTKYMREFREGNGEFFSEAVHHSKNSIVIGAQPSIPGTDQVTFALLGGPPSGSKATLRYLVTALNYGLTSFIVSPSTRPGHSPQFSHPEFWQFGLSLHDSTQPLFLEMLRETSV